MCPNIPHPWLRPLLGMVLVAVFAAPSAAAVLTVCASGCDASLVQAAVDMASAGDTIRLLDVQHTEADIVAYELGGPPAVRIFADGFELGSLLLWSP